MRDSSGIIGDPSGFDSGRLQLVILGDTEESGRTLGLDLMQTIEPERINQLLKEDSRALGEGEREIQSILKLLNIIPDEIKIILAKRILSLQLILLVNYRKDLYKFSKIKMRRRKTY